MHFWPSTALVYGIRIDYLSPTLYFLDLLIIFYLLILGRANLVQRFKLTDLSPFLLIIIINFLYSKNPLSSFNWTLHFLIYLTFIFSLTKSELKEALIKFYPLGVFFQLILSLLQVWLGHTIGGPLYYLGERSLVVGSPGIAMGSFLGQVVLRAYGTFSHPNVLGGWLVTGYYLYLHLTQNPKARAIVTVVIVIATLLTQSRSAALCLFFIIIPFLYLKRTFARAALYLIVSLFAIHFSYFSPPRFDLANQERRSLVIISSKIIQQYPIFGSGLESSISTYPTISPRTRLLQPDHNSLTLLLSWIGLFGTLAIFTLIPKNTSSLLYFLLPLVPLFLLDHYFLTSPQGLFLLVLCLYVGVNYPHVQKNRQQHNRPTSR